MQKGENMAKIIKFVDVMTFFLSLFHIEMSGKGKPFLSFSNVLSYLQLKFLSHFIYIFLFSLFYYLFE